MSDSKLSVKIEYRSASHEWQAYGYVERGDSSGYRTLVSGWDSSLRRVRRKARSWLKWAAVTESAVTVFETIQP